MVDEGQLRSDRIRKKERVWILGGGLGGLSTAWALSANEAARARFEVHVYQPGWRLGGKGRTGRNPNNQYRVIEHGLHAFGGYYHNVFRLLRACATDTEIHRLFEAETRIAFPIDLAERGEAPQPKIVAFDWPTLGENAPGGWQSLPGGPRLAPTVPQLIGRMISYLGRLDLFDPSSRHQRVSNGSTKRSSRYLSTVAVQQLKEVKERSPRRLQSDLGDADEAKIENLLGEAEQVAQMFSDGSRPDAQKAEPQKGWQQQQSRSLDTVGQLARVTLGLLEQLPEESSSPFELPDANGEAAPSAEERRALWRTVTRVCLASVVGILRFEADRKGLDCLNCLDFREFLQLSGASSATVNSGVVKGMYDYVFAYKDGDPDAPALAAGVAVRFMLLFFLDSEGGLQWHMTRGMGESVVLPLYEKLKEQGVNFHYYREACGMDLSADGSRVVGVRMRHQVGHPPEPKAGALDPYLATYEVRRPDDGTVERLQYWPDQPPPETLGGQPLSELASRAPGRADFGLEGPVAGAELPEPIQYWVSEDFDALVLAVPPAAVAPWLPKQLKPDWVDLIKPEHNVSTFSAQVWTRTKPRLRRFILVGGDDRAYPSVADMSHQLAYDHTGAEGLFFLVGQAKRRAGQTGASAAEAARRSYQAFVDRNADLHRSRFAVLEDVTDLHVQKNLLPADLYCCSAPHTVNRRPRADYEPVRNLALAGDWVKTGLDFGCAEAAVLAGFQAANKFLRRAQLPEVETYVAGGPAQEVL